MQIVEFFYAFDGTRVNPGVVAAVLRSFREVVRQEFLQGGCQQVANTSSVREPSPRFPLGSASEEISPFARRTGLLSRGVLTRSNRSASFVRMAKHRIAVSETMPISGLINTLTQLLDVLTVKSSVVLIKAISRGRMVWLSGAVASNFTVSNIACLEDRPILAVMRYRSPILILLSLPVSCAHVCARGKHEAPDGAPASAYLLGMHLILDLRRRCHFGCRCQSGLCAV